jgi:hypothetical protein
MPLDLALVDEDRLVERCARAERFALDVAQVVAATAEWRRWIRGSGARGRPATRALIDALEKAHPNWREVVTEMGHDTGEYPLERGG